MRSKIKKPSRPIAPLLLMALLAGSLGAASVQRFSLDELTQRSEAIFRGRVVAVEPGSLAVAGGTLPTTTVVFEIDEMLKGTSRVQVALTLAGSMKPQIQTGHAVRGGLSLGQPTWELEGTYVVFATRPSRYGLSTAVGLGQGSFAVIPSAQGEIVRNEISNAGLTPQRLTYEDLRARVLGGGAP